MRAVNFPVVIALFVLAIWWDVQVGLFALGVYLVLGVVILNVDAIVAVSLSFWPTPADYQQHIRSMKGKTMLITGANTGVGLACAQEAVRHGANVVLVCRSNGPETVKALQRLQQDAKQSIQSVYVDLGDFSTYKQLFLDLKSELQVPVDQVVLNAGMTCHPAKVTADGLDMMLQVNFVSNVLLVQGLVDSKLLNSDSARVVFTSSDSHRWQPYSRMQSTYNYDILQQVSHYAVTKLYNQMFCNYLVNSRQAPNFHVFSVCPGPVNTSIARHAPWYLRLFAMIFIGVVFQDCIKGARHVMYSVAKPAKLLLKNFVHYRTMQYERPLSKASIDKQNIAELMTDVQTLLREIKKTHELTWESL
jgi:NAD(P)-dependent dehydrogenase (short-subunit alcohol dehydrogenase family)